MQDIIADVGRKLGMTPAGVAHCALCVNKQHWLDPARTLAPTDIAEARKKGVSFQVRFYPLTSDDIARVDPRLASYLVTQISKMIVNEQLVGVPITQAIDLACIQLVRYAHDDPTRKIRMATDQSPAKILKLILSQVSIDSFLPKYPPTPKVSPQRKISFVVETVP